MGRKMLSTNEVALRLFTDLVERVQKNDFSFNDERGRPPLPIEEVMKRSAEVIIARSKIEFIDEVFQCFELRGVVADFLIQKRNALKQGIVRRANEKDI